MAGFGAPITGRFCAPADTLILLSKATLLPTTVQGQIFETNYDAGTIGEYTTTGGTVNANLVSNLNGPDAIALSGSDIYVANANAGTIGEYTTSGAAVNSSFVAFEAGLLDPEGGIAVSGSDLFFTNFEFGTISEYTTSGAVVNSALVSGLHYPLGLAISGSNLFVVNQGPSGSPYVNDGSIGEYTLGPTPGSVISSIASLVSGLVTPQHLAVSGPDLFVTYGNGYAGFGDVGEYTTSGAIVNASLVSGLDDPAGIASSSSDLFVANTANRIGEYTTSGATINASLVSGLYDDPQDVAVVVPEPATPSLIGMASLGLLARRRRGNTR